MFEALGIETLTPRQASVMLGLLLGVLFGVLAEVTRFCLRRAVAGDPAERRSAGGVWLAALVSAILGTQIAVVLGLISFDGHRFMAPDLPWLAVVAGGLLFGVGMVMTRGCISRLTVLLGSGNLRALLVLAVFAITAHSTLKGVLAPVRTTLGSATIPLGDMTSLAVLPGGALVWTALLVAVGVALAIRSGARPLHLGLAALLGLLVPAAWIGTGFVLFDEFDPIAMEGLSTTSSSAEGLFWLIASSSIPAGFGTGFIGGIVAGAFVGSVTSGRFRPESFSTPAQTARYLCGAILMGFGGVLAGGCTLGAGLSGVPTLSFAAILAIMSIVAGAVLADRVAGREPRATAVPAE